MRKRIIFWSIVLLALIFGFRTCYNSYRDFFYEYVSVLNFTNESETKVLLADAILMDLYCNLNEGNKFSAFDVNFKFSEIKKEGLIQQLNVELIALSKNDQVTLEYVLGFEDSINSANFDHSKIRVKRFELLPASAKRISTKRDFNGLTFHYKSKVKPLSKMFQLKITGIIIIDGKKIPLNKTMNLQRTKDWVEIQIMT